MTANSNLWCGSLALQGVAIAECARVVRTPELGSPQSVRKPMRNTELSGQESNEQLIKDINQIALEEVAECQVCGDKPLEGDGVVAFAFRAAVRFAHRDHVFVRGAHSPLTSAMPP